MQLIVSYRAGILQVVFLPTMCFAPLVSENWAADDLFARHTSMPHNPLIANAFFRSGQIEAWGRGIEKITNACKEWGRPAPFYRLRTNEVMIGFNTDASIGENIGNSIGENETQIKIMQLMFLKPTISAKAIASEIGIAPRNVETHISSMKKIGLVERIGPAKGGHWVIKLSNEQLLRVKKEFPNLHLDTRRYKFDREEANKR